MRIAAPLSDPSMFDQQPKLPTFSLQQGENTSAVPSGEKQYAHMTKHHKLDGDKPLDSSRRSNEEIIRERFEELATPAFFDEVDKALGIPPGADPGLKLQDGPGTDWDAFILPGETDVIIINSKSPRNVDVTNDAEFKHLIIHEYIHTRTIGNASEFARQSGFVTITSHTTFTPDGEASVFTNEDIFREGGTEYFLNKAFPESPSVKFYAQLRDIFSEVVGRVGEDVARAAFFDGDVDAMSRIDKEMKNVLEGREDITLGEWQEPRRR